MGVKVFPEHSSFWHYDDKLAQKYLFEQLNIPHAPMQAHYSKKDALEWNYKEAKFPYVFKLRKGFGSNNVILVKNKTHGKKLIKTMFGKGIPPVASVFSDFRTKSKKHKKKKDWLDVFRRFPNVYKSYLNKRKQNVNEKGYFLTQKFLGNNEFDTRVTIIGDKAFALRRMVRQNDFRASGSGDILYDKIDKKMIGIAFDTAEKIRGTSLAFDFIYDEKQNPKILEVSYCYTSKVLYNSGAYWNRNLERIESYLHPEYLIIEEILKS